jgi:hypothetical protein
MIIHVEYGFKVIEKLFFSSPQVPFWFMDRSPCWIKSETTELVFAASLLLMQYNTISIQLISLTNIMARTSFISMR